MKGEIAVNLAIIYFSILQAVFDANICNQLIQIYRNLFLFVKKAKFDYALKKNVLLKPLKRGTLIGSLDDLEN